MDPRSLNDTERRLERDLQPQSAAWQDRVSRALDQIWSQAFSHIIDHDVTPPSEQTPNLGRDSTSVSDAMRPSCVFSGITTTFILITSLHWRVFAPLVYLRRPRHAGISGEQRMRAHAV